MIIFSEFTLPGILFLLTLAFGFWVSRRGRPYNSILFNMHKLLALGAVILTVARLSRALQTIPSQGWLIVLLVLAVACVVALFASGALLSAGKLEQRLLQAVHHLALALLVLALAGFIYRWITRT